MFSIKILIFSLLSNIIFVIAVLVIIPFLLWMLAKSISKKEKPRAVHKILSISIKLFSAVWVSLVVFAILKATEYEIGSMNVLPGNLLQIRVGAEQLFDNNGGSYKRLSCNEDLYKIKQSCYSIKMVTGENPIIHTSKNEYCVYTRYPLTKDFYCVDNNGNQSRTQNDPSSSGYCDGQTFICPR